MSAARSAGRTAPGRAAGLVAAEFRKTASLPATAIAVAVTALVPAVLASTVAAGGASGGVPAVEAAFATMPAGTAGAVVLGVTAVSSEYVRASAQRGGGRQIERTLLAAPGRTTVLAAKLVPLLSTVAVATALATVVSVVAAVLAGAAGVGDLGVAAERAAGAFVYWSCTAVGAAAIAVVARNGLVPMLLLVVNGSLVSVSMVLTLVTPLARYLPDLAGARLFGDSDAGNVFADALDPLVGGLVMCAWTAAAALVAVLVLRRRDA